MYKILNDDKVLEILPKENADIKSEQMQIHIKHICGCLIVQDKSGSWWETCNEHQKVVLEFRKEKYIS